MSGNLRPNRNSFGSAGSLPLRAKKVELSSAWVSRADRHSSESSLASLLSDDEMAALPQVRIQTENGKEAKKTEGLTLVPKRQRCAVSMRADETDKWGADEVDEKEEYVLALRDPNIRVDLLDRLATFRRNKELCDVVLFVKEKEIYAHKVVLAAVSPALFDMFQESATAGTDSVNRSQSSSPPISAGLDGPSSVPPSTPSGGVPPPPPPAMTTSTTNASNLSYFEFEQTDYECFKALVNFAYTASLEISSKKVAELYKTAYSLRMTPVVKACANYLADNLCIANCIGIRKQANFSGDNYLMDKVDNFITEHVDSIVDESVEFTQLQCIKTRIIVPLEEAKSNKAMGVNLAERALQYFAEWQRKNPKCEHPLETLLSKTQLLYVEEDLRLADCADMDERSSVGSCEIIQDYKKSGKEGGGAAPDVVGAPPIQHRVTGATPVRMNNACRMTKNNKYSSTESLDSVTSTLSESEETIDTRLLAVHQTSDQFWVALVVLCRRLLALSIQLTDDEELTRSKPKDASGQSVDPQKAALLARLVNYTGTQRTPLAAMHDARCSIGAAFVHGKIIVCGGYDRGECLRSVEEYDVAAGLWRQLPPMKDERGRFDAAVYDGKVYAIAGSNGTNDLRSCEVYTPRTGKWQKIKSLSKPRSHNGCAALDGFIYTIGGSSDQVVLRECERYSIEADEWTPIAPLEIPRYQAGVIAWRGLIFAIGGCDRWNCTDVVEAYDPKTDTWRQMCKLRTPRRGCAVVVYRDALWVIGGHDGTQSLTTVEILEQPGSNWRPGPTLSTPRANTRAVLTAGSVIYVIGGFNGNHFLNTIELMEIEAIGFRNWQQHVEALREADEEGLEEEDKHRDSAGDQCSNEVGAGAAPIPRPVEAAN